MKRILLALLAVLGSATAQIPSVAPQPAGQAVVTGKSESDSGLSITLDQGRSTMTKAGQLSAAEVKAFRQLQVGRAYTFPEAFHLPADDSAEFTQLPLQALEKRSPFRALVDSITAADDRVALRLCCADGSKVEYLHTGTQDLDKARALVSGLQPEETYEFPAVLQGKQPAAPPAGWEPLDQYVGDWRGTLDGDASFFITMRCAWRTDGQGLWREIMFDDSSAAEPAYDVAIMTADAKSGQFQASDPRDPNKLPATGDYDAATRTFTTRLPSFKVGVIRRNTATFTDPNTITWKTLTRSDTGAVLSTTSGIYRRLTRKSVSADLAAVPSFGTPGALASLAESMTPKPPPRNELLNLQSMPPFRATVLKRQMTDDVIHLELRITNHEPVTVEHAGKEGWDKARKVAECLEEGRTYEFPDVMADTYAPPAPGTPPQPATDAMRALQPFVGTWKDPARTDTIRWFWKEDGSGLWRETTTTAADAASESLKPASAPPGGEAKDNLRIRPVLITYDAGRRCYLERQSIGLDRFVAVQNGVKNVFYTVAQGEVAHKNCEGHWDAATQTFTWSDIRDQPQPNSRFSGSHRFVSPDRIEWKSQMMAPDGKILQEHSGHYERVAP